MDESMRRPLIVVCAGGRASEIASYVRDLQAVGDPVCIQAYVDDYRFGTTFEGAPILGGVDHLGMLVSAHHTTRFWYIVAIEDNQMRSILVQRIDALGAPNLTPWTLRHPRAVIGDAVQIGVGTCIGPSAVITTNASIGDHCIVDALSSISHDSGLASFVNVSPGVAIGPHVKIGVGSIIGAGATVTRDIWVGEWSVIAAGAVVTDDVPSHVTVAGAPAAIVKRHRRRVRQPIRSIG